MRVVLRIVATTLIAAAAAAAVYRFGYAPVKANYVTGVLQASGRETARVTDDYTRLVRVRRDLARARALIEQTPERATPYVIAAANEWLLGRREEALELYQRALAYDRRPEILLRMGILHCELGNVEQARQHLTQACLFNPILRFSIPPTCPQEGIDAAAIAHAKMLEKR